jgi:hypothetical protein
VDAPAPNSAQPRTFLIGGWAFDAAAASGTGIDAIHIWAIPNPGSGAAPLFLGAAAYGGARPDVGAIFGSQFTASGFNRVVTVPPGVYDIAVFPHSSVSGTFAAAQVVRINVP